jgi:hypothetical protein
MLAGCGGSQPPISTPSAMPPGAAVSTRAADRIQRAPSFRVLHRFGGSPDGAIPLANLIDVNGTLYGTTSEGGRSGCGYGLGCGTVYSVTTTGSEKVRHIFAGGTDGFLPAAALIDKSSATGNTRHYRGYQQLPPPHSLEIVQEESSGGYYLLYLDTRGRAMTDTWHGSIEAAMAQANFEFGLLAWQRLCSG